MNIIKDPKLFWNYIKNKQSKRTKNIIKRDNVAVNDSEGAEIFASYFHTVYSTQRPVLDPMVAEEMAGPKAGAARVHVTEFNERDVRSALNRLKPKHSVGPDGIPPYIVRDCREVLWKPLLHIFNLCLKISHYPDIWKTTKVTPVPKGCANDNITGYRPVAVLSTFAKVFESALYSDIYKQISSRLTDNQHGFRQGRSTSSNLLSFMTYLTPVIDAGGQVDCAYFDFQKAFDTVDNDILLSKLSLLGYTPHLLKFFASYLAERRQYVEYAGYKSRPYYTFSGISQGSNLGPLEFILMVNDLPEIVQDADCLLFADDLKVYLTIKDASDAERLQKDINRIVQWGVTNKLTFNISKCGIMSYSRAKNPQQYTYKINNESILRLSHTRDLGVEMVPELTFRKHITKICSKAFRKLGFILRICKDFNNISAIKILYNTLVRSYLETSAIVWNPHESKYILMLEKIQNKFTRFLYMKQYGVYPFYPLMYPSLFVLGMVGYDRLSVRRDMSLACYVWRVLCGQLHHPAILAMLNLCTPAGHMVIRGQRPALSVPAARTNMLTYAPLTRAIKLINTINYTVDIYHCSLREFTDVAYKCVAYN